MIRPPFRVENMDGFVRPQALPRHAEHRAVLAERGGHREDFLDTCTDVIDEIAVRAPMVLGLHLCRGDKGGAWQTEGGQEHVATSLFRRSTTGGCCLECASPRVGGLEPLREVPDGQIVVPDLVSASAFERDLRCRVSASFVPLDLPGVSAQCGGFAGDVAVAGSDASDGTERIDLLFRLAKETWDEAAAEPVPA